jgi:2-dehydropantoate 2-reductase
LVAANGLHEGCFHLGLLYGGAYLDPPRLACGAGAKLLVGALPGTEERVAELVELLGTPWLVVGGHEEIVKRMWHKLVLNCVANPLSGLLDCINGKLLPHLEAPLVHGLLGEAERVARRVVGETWTFGGAALHQALRELLEATAENSSSMREDLRAGRETEIERLNLAVAETGLRLGLPCPLNEGLGRMVFLLAGQERPA